MKQQKDDIYLENTTNDMKTILRFFKINKAEVSLSKLKILGFCCISVPNIQY